MTTVALVVQARMGSTRLPGKVALPVAGEPMLFRMLERLARVRSSVETIVATTCADEDDTIVAIARRAGVDVVRGHPTDLVARHLEAARRVQADVVVKVPSDCPLIDPDIVDRVLAAFLRSPDAYDYVGNLHPASYPDGCDVEVMSREALEIVNREAVQSFEREHTTPFLWDRPERFRIGRVTWETGLDLSREVRLTVDYFEDYALVAGIYDALHPKHGAAFTLRDILELLERRPDLAALNASHRGRSWIRDHARELRTIRPARPPAEGSLDA